MRINALLNKMNLLRSKLLATAILLFSVLLSSCGSSGLSQEVPMTTEVASETTIPSTPSAPVQSDLPDIKTPEATVSATLEPTATPLAVSTPEPAVPSTEPDISVPSGEWTTLLVNPSHLLPEGFDVAVADFAGGQVDARILDICKQMFSDAKAAGITFILVDAYRSYDLQNELYQKKVDSYIEKGFSRADAEKEAATITARPNTSEHQTGLALDIVTSSYKVRDKGFSDTKAYQWLDENAHRYGFTLRYKQNKESFTKVIFEPWHWRFVGTEAAAAMKESGECLEEYLDEF